MLLELCYSSYVIGITFVVLCYRCQVIRFMLLLCYEIVVMVSRLCDLGLWCVGYVN